MTLALCFGVPTLAGLLAWAKFTQTVALYRAMWILALVTAFVIGSAL